MTLDAESLTKAQLKAVRWLHRQSGRIIVPPIHKGDAYEMHGTTRGPSREPLTSLVWRGTFNALFHRDWLVMDGPDAWKLSPAGRIAVHQAHVDTEGFTKEVT